MSDGIQCVSADHELCLERVDVDAVHRLDKERFNCNNIWLDGKRPDDYEEQQTQNVTSTWIDQFHRAYSVCNLDAREQRWMYRAWLIGRVTGQFPKQYEDELEVLLARHGPATDHLFAQGRSYFVRTESVSLKTGVHKVGPYQDLKSIVESIVTCRQGHAPLDRCDPEAPARPLKIYLMPWLELVRGQEFRVFVCGQRVTCISQQGLYSRNEVLCALPSDEARVQCVRQWCRTVLGAFGCELRDKLAPRTNYSMDLSILPDGKVYFIECNSYGSGYAAGSSLFHWTIDHDQMHGEAESLVNARFVY